MRRIDWRLVAYLTVLAALGAALTWAIADCTC